MKGENIEKYQQKELNMMCKTDEKMRNNIIFLPCAEMSTEAEKIDFRGQKRNQIQQNVIFVL